MSISIEVHGMDKLVAKLRDMGTHLTQEMAQAIKSEAEIEMTEAMKRTPVKRGWLRASGRVTGPASPGQGYEVRISFGGPTPNGEMVDYAVAVHENMDSLHPVGQAKYLESVIVESRPHFYKRVIARMKRQP